MTGGASGIGLGIARALTGAGAHVVVADLDEEAAQTAAAQLSLGTTRTLGLGCDVTDPPAVEHLATQAWDTFGHVDLAINNAGVTPRPALLINGSEADARWVLDVNVIADGREMPGSFGIPADEVGERVVAGIRRGDFYILTHPLVREIVDERYEELIHAFESQVPRFAGDEVLDTRRLSRRKD